MLRPEPPWAIKPTPGVQWPQDMLATAALINQGEGGKMLNTLQWREFKRKFQQLDRASYVAWSRHAERRRHLRAARRLSIADIQMILNEKLKERSNGAQRT